MNNMNKENYSIDYFEYFIFGVWYFYAFILYVVLILFSNIIMSLIVFLAGELSLWTLYSYISKKTGKSYAKSKYSAMVALALMYIIVMLAYVVLIYVGKPS